MDIKDQLKDIPIDHVAENYPRYYRDVDDGFSISPTWWPGCGALRNKKTVERGEL